jgi:hypothetical protein
MLKSSRRRRNAFYRKALITAQKSNLRLDDTINIYHLMADSKRIERLSKRYGTTTQWDKAERGTEGPCMISVPILLHVKNEIIGWRTFPSEKDVAHAKS